jgi:CHAT domain-containing protein
MLADAVGAIERAPPGRQTDLAAAHAAHGEARRLLRQQKLTGALEGFSLAERDFENGNSPFALWARFDAALTINYRQRPAEAAAALAAIAHAFDPHRYPALSARISWVRGLAASVQGRVEESNASYRSAAATFCRLGERENLAATQGLLAAGLAKLGHYDSTWTLTRSALARRADVHNLQRLQAILQDAVFDAHRQGLPRAGLLLADEFVPVALREGSPDNVHNAFMRRAALHEALGHTEAARADLKRAVAVLPRFNDKALLGRAEADRAVEEARILLSASPAEAVERLELAIDTYQNRKLLQKLPEARALRARGLLALGRVQDAEKDIEKESRLLEATLFGDPPGPAREDRVAVLRDSFDQMVEVQANELHDGASAFRFAEQERHWALWEWAGGVDPGMRGSPLVADPLAVASWLDLRAAAGERTAVVAYYVLPNRLLIWASSGPWSTMKIVPSGRAEVRSRVGALLAAAGNRDLGEMDGAARSLFDLLIAPVHEAITGATQLIVIPDRELQQLPFGLLRSPRGAYLYQEQAIAYAPSATAYVRLARAIAPAFPGIRRVLATGATSGPRPVLRRLPEAAAEAAAVAGAWPEALATPTGDVASLRRELARADAFHFAGHAVLEGGSLQLVLRDDRTNPLRVTAASLLGERPPHLRLVSLSGCRTADVASKPGTARSSAGFVRSFLAAGVPTVAASFLELDDRQARDIFVAFHRKLAAGEVPAVAMSRACLEAPLAVPKQRPLLCGSVAVFGVSRPFTK